MTTKPKTPKEWAALHLQKSGKVRDKLGADAFDQALHVLIGNFLNGAPEKPDTGACMLIAGALSLMRNLLQAQDPNYKPPAPSDSPSKPPDVIIGAVAITVETNSKPPEGSVLGTCSQCGVKVHMSPSSQQIMREADDVRVLCMKDDGGCLDEALAKEKTPPVFGVTSMGMKELRELYKGRQS